MGATSKLAVPASPHARAELMRICITLSAPASFAPSPQKATCAPSPHAGSPLLGAPTSVLLTNPAPRPLAPLAGAWERPSLLAGDLSRLPSRLEGWKFLMAEGWYRAGWGADIRWTRACLSVGPMRAQTPACPSSTCSSTRLCCAWAHSHPLAVTAQDAPPCATSKLSLFYIFSSFDCVVEIIVRGGRCPGPVCKVMHVLLFVVDPLALTLHEYSCPPFPPSPLPPPPPPPPAGAPTHPASILLKKCAALPCSSSTRSFSQAHALLLSVWDTVFELNMPHIFHTSTSS